MRLMRPYSWDHPMMRGEIHYAPSVYRMNMAFWLMKSEPHVYPWKQLVEDGNTHWDGVRNYQARNIMRDDMKIGDFVLFYHSNCKPPHVAGVSKVCREAYPDFTALDSNSNYFEPKSSPDNPRWMMVDIEAVEGFPDVVPLGDMRENGQLEGMPLLQRGQRLSVQPVSHEHFDIVCRMGGLDPSSL